MQLCVNLPHHKGLRKKKTTLQQPPQDFFRKVTPWMVRRGRDVRELYRRVIRLLLLQMAA